MIGHITVVDMRSSAVAALRDSESIKRCFPDQSFDTCPAPGEPDSTDPELYKKVLAKQKPYQMVIIALPDQLHYPVLKGVLEFNQHVLCVKPLVLKYDQAMEIEKEARERGCFVGVEYHKRFDRRNLIARKTCRKVFSANLLWGKQDFLNLTITATPTFRTGSPAKTRIPLSMWGATMLTLSALSPDSNLWKSLFPDARAISPMAKKPICGQMAVWFLKMEQSSLSTTVSDIPTKPAAATIRD